MSNENEDSKICSICQEEKSFSCFSKQKLGKNGLRSYCKECNASYCKKYHAKYPRKPKTLEQYLKNQKYLRDKYRSDPIYRENYLKKARVKKNSEKCKIKTRAQRNIWIKNPKNRIAKNLRDRMRSALNGKSKAKSTLEMTGIPFEDLRTYLESKFLSGMTWENYGKWHIDHIIPCIYFDFTNTDHQKICFYYKNLQPMWAKDNISKGGRITIENFQSLIEEIKIDLNIPF